MNTKHWIGILLSIGTVWFCFYGIGVLFCNTCCCGTGRQPQKVADGQRLAWAAAKTFVEERLGGDNDASYGSQRYQNCVEYLGDGRFVVEAFVDHKNRFGGAYRTRFTVILQYEGGNQWTALTSEGL
jgi:hypothetical protein